MTISTINPATPDSTDPVGSGDNEIRAFKQAIRDQFPDVLGDAWDIALTVGPRTINTIADKVDGETFDELEARVSGTELVNAAQGTQFGTIESRLAALESAGYVTAAQAMNASWPVGSTFISYDGDTPATKGLPGTWTRFADGKVLFGSATPGTNREAGSNALTLVEANLPAHRHLILTSTAVNNGPIPLATTSVQRADSRGGGDLGWTLSGNVAEPTLGRTSQTGSGTAADTTPEHVKVSFYRRTA